MVLSPPRICCDFTGSTFCLVPSPVPPWSWFPLSERTAGLRAGAAENLVSSLVEAALSDVGADLAETQCSPVSSQSSLSPLDLSLQSTALFAKPPLFLYLLLEC